MNYELSTPALTSTGERRILHVLPHPGGGGETYVDSLAGMSGYCFEKVFLAPNAMQTAIVLPRAIRAQVGSRHHDLLHVHGEIASAACLPAIAVRPSIVTIHGLHLVRRLNGSRRALAEATLRLVVRAASATICVGEVELADVRTIVGNTGDLVLIRNGVDPAPPLTANERSEARAKFGLLPSDTVGVYVAALDAHKEPLVAARAALEAARDGASIMLIFAGEGPLRGQLETLAGESTSVRVLGFQRDVRRVLAAADFFVLPSRREGLSFALMEAMSLGLPPVVSQAAGNPEVVGDAGIVLPCGDIAGFAAAFARLAGDEQERRSLGARARARMDHHFTRAEMVRRTGEVYDQVLAEQE